MSVVATEPVSTAPDLHADFHISANGPMKRRVYSVEEVQLDVGPVSMYLNVEAIDRLLEELTQAKYEIGLLAKEPDPLPPLE